MCHFSFLIEQEGFDFSEMYVAVKKYDIISLPLMRWSLTIIDKIVHKFILYFSPLYLGCQLQYFGDIKI